LSALTLEAVTKNYGTIPALRGLDLRAGDGELLAVLGPSGSGKSTLLRIVAGLEPVTSGAVVLAGRDVTKLPPGRRNVSMVFQSYALFPHLTVAENIGFGLAVRGHRRKDVRRRVGDVAELVGCAPLLGRRPGELSGGERQRIALARALVREPDLFLLDEPLSNLDAELRVQMRAELKTLHARVGATMVYVTHDQVEALGLGDRVAVLRDGALAQIGTPDELWNAPADRFVARFVGTPAMNVLPFGTLPIDGPLPPGRPPDSLEVGVRPDAVRLDATGGRPGRVALVERVGADAHVHVEADGFRLVARVPAERRPEAGAAVAVSARRADIHLFDVETGQRVAWT